MLKINVGLSKKIGEPNYGSRGASVNFDVELDSGLIVDQERLRERIRRLYQLARDALHEELHREAPHKPAPQQQENDEKDNERPSGNGDAPRPATDSQVRALYAISRRQNVDLPALIQKQYGFWQPEDLSLDDASALIDELNHAVSGSSA